MDKVITKLRQFRKTVRKGFKNARKSGLLGKIVVLIATLALIATSVLPFIL